MASGPIPRARPLPVEKRESMLRASILDTALELGVGTSSTVAHWIFNPVDEAEEDTENLISPSLTYASTATSDDSLLSPSAASRLARSGAGSQLNPNTKPSASEGDVRAEPVRKDSTTTMGASLELSSTRAIQFDLSTTPEPRAPSPLPPAKHRKLRKAKHDGNESDGGYMSDATKSEKERRPWRRDKKEKSKAQGSDEESDGGYLSDILRKRRNKKKNKDNLKVSGSPLTDHEADGGYVSSSSLARKKKSKAPSTPGDESDVGNLSESSTKKKRFFRLNNRSRKRGDSETPVPEIIPPVPSLPPILPVAERFMRSETPASTFTESSRALTPALTEQTMTQRSSDDVSIFDTNTPSTPLDSPKGLTKAFADAQSVRTPSTDVLRAFGRQAGLSALRSPTREHTNSHRDSDGTQGSSSMSSMQSVPVLDLPQPKRTLSLKRTPPQISAPNTQALSAKPQPVPITVAPPSPEGSIGPVRMSPGTPNPETGSMLMVMQTTTPTSSLYIDSMPHSPATTVEYNLPTAPLASPMSASASSPAVLPIAARSHLSKYDIPPPSPPPMGPLPLPPTTDGQIPDSRRSSRATRIGDRPLPSPLSKSSTDSSTHPDVLASRRSPLRAAAGSVSSSNSSMHLSTSSASLGTTAPLFLQRAPSAQRGKEPPFPTRPVFPRTESATDISTRPLAGTGRARAAAMEGPRSADPILHSHSQSQQQLRLHQPHSAPVHSRERKSYEERPNEDSFADDHESWVDFSSTQGSESNRSSMESHPDIDSVLAALQDHPPYQSHHTSYASASGSGSSTDAPHHGFARPSVDLDLEINISSDAETDYPDPRSTQFFDEDDAVSARYNPDARSTQFFDEDDGVSARYSMWSEAGTEAADRRSRASLLDPARSSESRAKLMKRVAQMYSKDGIAQGLAPPVPAVPGSRRDLK